MKTTRAGLAVLSGLAAVVTADALPPEEIPMECATICGPMVELTSICDVHWKRLKKRKMGNLDSREWVPKLAVEPPKADQRIKRQHAPQEKQAGAGEQLEKRSFSIIRAAPTSFPASLIAAESSTLSTPESTSLQVISTSRPTRIIPVVETTSTSTNPRSPSSASSTSSIPATTVSVADDPVLTSTSFSTVASSTSTAWDDVTAQKGQGQTKGSAEQQCVCLNDSFDVPKVAALCSSCIAIAGFPQNNMDVIMSECNFTALTWSPDKDKVANNIRVKATKPSTLAGYNAGVASEATTTMRSASIGLAMSLVGLVLGATMLL